MDAKHYDIVIVGAGLVGSSLVRALAQQDLRIALIEAHSSQTQSQSARADDRALALSVSSQRYFQAIGLWSELIPHASPIHHVHISNRGRFGFARLPKEELGHPALGYVIGATPLSQIVQHSFSGQSNLDVYQPATLTKVQTHAKQVQLQLQTDSGAFNIHSRLLVMADGGHSRDLLPLAVETHDFGQAALICNVDVNQEHHGKAYERFTDNGPLALLPLKGRRYAVVWTLDSQTLSDYLALDDSAFLQALQQQFGWRAGQFTRAAPRSSWLLRQEYMPSPGTGRILCVGNAAHKMHPVAGQGLNLGLRDIAVLAELLTDTNLTMPSLVQQYLRQRLPVQQRLLKRTTLLVNSFSNTQAGMGLLRNLGLLALDHTPPLKTWTMRYLTGLEDSHSRLLRGLALNA